MSALVVYVSDSAAGCGSGRCRHIAGINRLLQAAEALGETVVLHAVTGKCGSCCAEAMQECCRSHSVAELLKLELAEKSLDFEQVAQFIINDISGGRPIDTIVLEDSAVGTNIAAYAGVGLNAGAVTRVQAINRQGKARKVVFGGSGIVESQIVSTPRIVTVDLSFVPKDQGPVGESSPAAGHSPLKIISVTAPKGQEVIASWQRGPKPKDDRPALREAKIVVAGGRGIGEDWAIIDELVDAIGDKQGGTAVGATKAAVDLGWIGHEAQIGQTGVVVSPDLYVSAGISGAQQQKSGMQASRTILAVNTDPDAPVFELADFGIVGDAHQVLPALKAEIEKRLS